MFGIFYDYIEQNGANGEAIFRITPREHCTMAENGLLMCKGVIGIYLKGMPIVLDGSWSDGIYKITADSFPTSGKEALGSMLEYIYKDLTDKQTEIILGLIDKDLDEFIKDENSLEKMRNGLSKYKNGEFIADRIYNEAKALFQLSDMMKELYAVGLTLDRIELLISKGFTLTQIKQSPYHIFTSFNIPIECAEKLASTTEYNPARLAGFVNLSMKSIENSGNTCATYPILLDKVNIMFEKHGTYKTRLDMSFLKIIVKEMAELLEVKIINNEEYIYRRDTLNAEENALRNLSRLLNSSKNYQMSSSIEDIENSIGIKYNTEQRQAFKSVKKSGVKIITGPPGSGKTALIHGLIKAFNGSVALAATTGMAAKVLSVSTKMPAVTLNSLLNVRPFDAGVTGKDINEPIDADLIIVDETSMMGLPLFSVLTGAVKTGSILILVGDDNQLQSVDRGNILSDLIASGKVEVYRLTEVMRSSGTICENAIRINNENSKLITDASFFIGIYDNENMAYRALLKNYKRNQSQIICPVKNGKIGTHILNKAMQDKSTPVIAKYGETEFHIGNKVVMTKNNYEKDYRNGDIGIVTGSKDELMLVNFNGCVKGMSKQDMYDMELAEAITIHKSQGSEFTDVHIILPMDDKGLNTKRLLYTAVTRAKTRVFIYEIGNQIEKSIRNTNEKPRLTTLKERIIQRQ